MHDEETIALALLAIEEGMSTRQAAEFCGASRESVRCWAKGMLPHRRRGAAGRSSPKSPRRPAKMAPPEEEVVPVNDDERAAYEAAILENQLLRAVLADLKAGGWDPASISNRRKTELGERLREATGLPLREITAFLRISKSSYEYHRSRLGDVGVREAIGEDVERIFREEGRSARGYRFVHAVLVSELGHPVSEKVVRDVMRERGLEVVYGRTARKHSSYEGETDAGAPNLPYDPATGRHDFHADAPGEKLASDVTEFNPTGDYKVFLSPVVDLFDGKPIAWSISGHPDSELADSSLLAACEALPEGKHPFCHTDRGGLYRSASWKAICSRFGIERSMSRKGKSPDNAAMEGFFGRLKNEFFHGRDWSGVDFGRFVGLLDEWMRYYSSGRLKAFRVDGKVVYDTIDNRRRQLGYAI